MNRKLGVVVTGICLAFSFSAIAQTPTPSPSLLPEVIQPIFQLGATTHQQVAARIGEMQGKIDLLTKELEAAKKNCPVEQAK